MFKRLLKPTAFKLALAIGVLCSAWHLASTSKPDDDNHRGYLRLLESKALDAKFVLRGALPLSHRVALAEVDERAVEKYGLWPWNRGLLAKAIDNLVKAGAGSVALDIVVGDEDRNSAYSTLSAISAKLPPPDPSVEARAQTVATKAPPEVRQVLEQLVQEHRTVSDDVEALRRAAGQSPDDALHEVLVRDRSQVVLGTIGFRNLAESGFSAAQATTWPAQVRSSVIPTAFRLDGVGPKPVKQQAWSSVVGYGLVEPWLAKVAPVDAHLAFFSTSPDADGVNRRYAPVRAYPGGFVPSLAFGAIAQVDGFPPTPIQSLISADALDEVAVNLGSDLVRAPVDALDSSRMLINWLGPNSNWRRLGEGCKGAECDRVSLADVVDNTFDPAVVKGKVVFVSVTALGTFDQKVTPYDQYSPGIFIHMNVAEDVLSQRFMEASGTLHLFEAALLLFFALAFGVALPRLPLLGQVATVPVASVLYQAGNFAAFRDGVQLFSVIPVLEFVLLGFSIIAFQYMTTDKEKRQVRQAFQYYLTESVMTEMLKDPSKLKLGGEKKNLTVLFSDIRGFTTLSEMLEPSEVVRRLNEYLTPMTNLVFSTGGTLDKYMGDAIMAFWGAPVDQPDHALRACETACKMLEQLDVLRAKWKQHGEADIDIGIGLNSGNIHVGNMGSDNRFDYTVIGDDVNLASRLEGTNKSYGTRVIIGENTYQQVKGKVVSRELGGVVVKGKKKPVTIYELRKMGAPDERDAQGIAEFEKGLAAYRARNWDAAEAAFKAVQELWPHDGPSEKYLDDIAEKRLHPPDAGWDGVYVMKTK